MKLDIEELISKSNESAKLALDYSLHEGFDRERMKAFASLIVERCASVCDQLQIPNGLDLSGVMPSSAWETGTIDCADAILKLLED